MLLAAMPVSIHRLMVIEGALLGTEPGQDVMRRELVVLDANQHGIAGLGGTREPLLLTMQGIGGEEHARQTPIPDQHRHGRDLARRPRPLLVGPEERGVTGESARPGSRL